MEVQNDAKPQAAHLTAACFKAKQPEWTDWLNTSKAAEVLNIFLSWN